MMKLIEDAAQKAIQNKVFPGVVIGYVKKNGERGVLPFGHFTYDQGSKQVEEETIYDTASITKSIPTASLALMLIDQGKLRITDKLIDFVPEFRNIYREEVLIKHLLTYTLGGYGMATAMLKDNLKNQTVQGFTEVLMTKDFEQAPGTLFKYTNLPATFLGLVIEKIMSDTLDVLADQHLFKPLQMSKTTFHPEHFDLEEIVPTEIDDWRGEVRGIVHDESAYICAREKKVVGHAGIFSTAGDILTFLEMLLNDGKKNGHTFFSENILKEMETNQIPELNEYNGLGWELYQPRYMGTHANEHTFGKTGFTGTLCVCDRAKGIAYVILSNRIYPKRPVDSTLINQFRAEIGTILLSPNA